MIDPDTNILQPDAAFHRALAAQADAAQPLRSAWVEANAGSGKTKVLIDRVARLLLRQPDGRPGAQPNSILCITYTKAAANEMLSRLFERLGAWSVASDKVLRDSLADLEGRSPTDYDEAALRDARALFARALETPGGLRIETIHAFCARVLRRFPLEAGVSPSFVEIEEDEANALWDEILSSALITAAEARPDAVAIVSKAAGGLGLRAAFEALRPHRHALLAFQASLADETEQALMERVREALGAGAETAESLIEQAAGLDFPADKIAHAIKLAQTCINPSPDKDKKVKGFLAKLEKVLETPPGERRFELYLDAIAGSKRDWSTKTDPYQSKSLSGSPLADLFSRNQSQGDPEGREITRMKHAEQAVKSAAAAARTVALLSLGLPVLEAYQSRKADRSALDFDDLIHKTKGLVTESQSAAWVLYKLDGGLSHILLDEAQDTSPPQWALINALVEEFQAGAGQRAEADVATQFVVGDPKQSIYSFQGADQAHFQAERYGFLRREQALTQAPNLPEMTMSFRSGPEILDFVDEVRACVPLESAATDPLPPREADLPPHQPRRAGQPGRVELWPLIMPDTTDDLDSDWTAPPDYLSRRAPPRELARKIAKTVAGMIASGQSVWYEDTSSTKDRIWRRRPVQAEDFLILVRRRSTLFDAIIDSLKKEGLDVAGADRLQLLDHIGVQDCLNLIRFALQPADDLTLAEILRGPFCNLTDDNRHLFKLAYGRSAGETLWTRLQAATDPIFAAAQDFCARLIATSALPAFEFLTQHLTQRCSAGLSGWDKLIHRLGQPVRDPVRALLMRGLTFDTTQPASLQAFLAEIEASNIQLKRDLGDANGAIRVMTVHGAKGLQSPVVILPDTTSATKPARSAVLITKDGTPVYSASASADNDVIAELRERQSEDQERESRRLLYVALTRAQDRLIICGAGLGNATTGYAKSAWYRWCLQAMKGLTPQTDWHHDEDGPPLSYGELPPLLPAQDEPDKGRAPAIDTDWVRKPARGKTQTQRLIAPSALVADTSPVARPMGAARRFSLRRGRAIHDLFERLAFHEPSDWPNQIDSYLARGLGFTAEERAEIAQSVLGVLNSPDFAHIFDRNGRSEAAIVGQLPSGQIVNGRVDRLVVSEHAVLIVDFKTDRPAPRSVTNVGKSYLLQMAMYREILQQIYTDGRTMKCALLYTDGPTLVDLPDQLLLETLKDWRSAI